MPVPIGPQLRARRQLGCAGHGGQAAFRRRVRPTGATLWPPDLAGQPDLMPRSRHLSPLIVAFTLLAGAGPATSGSQALSAVPRPAIVVKLIPFGAKRRAETAAYARRHYGIDTWRLDHPHVIVEHYTASDSLGSTYAAFSSDAPDLGEFPGVCTHFVIDRDGTIYQLVALRTMCRHTVGLNWTAFGIEHVGRSDAEILRDPAQLSASLALTLWLMSLYHIRLRDVLGHAESLSSPYHRERYRAWRCQTHADWQPADMRVYRAKLARLARRYGVRVGPSSLRVAPRCS
ncbi:MAG: hypothetical protein C5B48_09580 [Candidatus Rokuibacteriota bacterium]|nr:MAG: hypothetical protein C5B48_09580 [Candidatus Rokubacteria bacterium]